MNTLKDYLVFRTKGHPNLRALSRVEASLIGIPYPLRKNWPRNHANVVIPDHVYAELVKVLSQSREEKKIERAKKEHLKALSWGWVAPLVQSAPATKRRTVRVKPAKQVPSVATDSFLRTFEWRKVRMQALKKYGTKCMCCGATPATGAVMNVDHIKPRKLWPSLALDINNLQILCHDCNHGKGNWDMTDWRNVNPIAFPK
jgi:5-methylcytosine-specific restriction endonuclease McrA